MGQSQSAASIASNDQSPPQSASSSLSSSSSLIASSRGDRVKQTIGIVTPFKNIVTNENQKYCTDGNEFIQVSPALVGRRRIRSFGDRNMDMRTATADECQDDDDDDDDDEEEKRKREILRALDRLRESAPASAANAIVPTLTNDWDRLRERVEQYERRTIVTDGSCSSESRDDDADDDADDLERERDEVVRTIREAIDDLQNNVFFRSGTTPSSSTTSSDRSDQYQRQHQVVLAAAQTAIKNHTTITTSNGIIEAKSSPSKTQQKPQSPQKPHSPFPAASPRKVSKEIDSDALLLIADKLVALKV